MKIRQTIFLLPLFLLAGCASAGGSQSRDLDLKELCTEEQVFQYADFEWGTDSEQLFKQSSLKFDEKDLGQGDESSTKTYESKEKFSLENAESNMDLEFSDGQLSQVSFTFDIEQDANTWIQKEVDEFFIRRRNCNWTRKSDLSVAGGAGYGSAADGFYGRG